jgi:hypothetical protein
VLRGVVAPHLRVWFALYRAQLLPDGSLLMLIQFLDVDGFASVSEARASSFCRVKVGRVGDLFLFLEGTTEEKRRLERIQG